MLTNRILELSKIFVTLNGKTAPQRVYLEINQHFTRIDYERNDNEMYSDPIRMRRVLRLYLPVVPTVAKANWILDHYFSQLLRINDGHEVVYNHELGDYEGVLTDDAERAIQEIADGICSISRYKPGEFIYRFDS